MSWPESWPRHTEHVTPLLCLCYLFCKVGVECLLDRVVGGYDESKAMKLSLFKNKMYLFI